VFAQVLGKLEQISQELIPGTLEAERAVELFNDAARAERFCTAIKCRLARRVEETKVWRDSGHRSAAHWVAEATGETVGAAARTLETARALEQLPETDAAFRAGQLSDAQAAEITSTAVADPSAEAELLEAAGSTSVKGLRDRCREVRAGAETDDQAWARRLYVSRRAHEWTDPDGAYRVEARLAPDAGARFSSAWKAHTDRIFCDARRAGRREPHAAYAADALVALASEGPCKPVEVRVTVDSAALSRGHSERGERCEIGRVGPVPVTTARALLDDASVAVLIRDGDDSRPSRHRDGLSRPSCGGRSRRATRPVAFRPAPTTSSSRSTTSSPSPSVAAPRSRTSGGCAPTTTDSRRMPGGGLSARTAIGTSSLPDHESAR
jgi:hypothetical protein